MRTIDFNADLGEGGTEDDTIIGLIHSANIACGGHAGNEATMRRTIATAMAAGIKIGAHLDTKILKISGVWRWSCLWKKSPSW
ncbi:MAG: hypothetical protein HC845_01100 [Akkermansiaceae bacterium]|nr:hypothetical protein [Akkermansiaceae bacterium]